jgi:type I restriction enzyme R subunit
MLYRDDISKADRERLKQGSHQLLAALTELLRPMQQWTQKEQTQAEVEVFILDKLFEVIPMPPYTAEDAQAAAERVYQYVWQRSATGHMFAPSSAA